MKGSCWCGILVASAGAVAARGQLMIPSDGSDGVFSPVANVQIDLGLANAAAWDTPGTGNGVYDGEKWVVVFKYSSVNIPAGVTVTFLNHPKNGPVVWLVQNDVTIAGTVSLDGANNTASAGTPSVPGPGGYRGGRARVSATTSGSGGYGPGGGNYFESVNHNAGSGGYGGAGAGNGGSAGRSYGHESVVPLLGGSGSGAFSGESNLNAGGGAGGGAILIAAGGVLTINGTLRANGGTGGAPNGSGGSGGGIRLIAETVGGTGQVRALGGTGNFNGGAGRIAIESISSSLAEPQPAASYRTPTDPPAIWPDAAAMSLRATQLTIIDGNGMPQNIPISSDPAARLDFPQADAMFETEDPVTVHVEAVNVPLDWIITVRMVPLSGDTAVVTAAPLSGTQALSTTTATLDLSGGFSAIQVIGDAP